MSLSEILENTARDLVTEDADYQLFLDLALEIKRQFPDEINIALAADQAETAHENYHGITVQTGGYEFHVTRAARILTLALAGERCLVY